MLQRVYKSATGNRNKRNILPTSCPYMVYLHKFYETSSTIYLLLQYASGGKLWDYVGAYLRYAQDQAREGGPGLDEAYPAQEFQNVYTGYKVHQDNNKRQSFIEEQTQPSKNEDNVVLKTSNQTSIEVKYDKLAGDVLLQVPSQNSVKDLSVDDFQFDTHDAQSRSVEGKVQDLVIDSAQVDKSETKTESETTKVQYNRFTSFSSEENDDDTNAPVSYDRQNSAGTQFHDLLQNNTKKAALENFSINSFDSTEGVVRIDSNLSDHIEVIQEVNEGLCESEVFKPGFSDISRMDANDDNSAAVKTQLTNGDGFIPEKALYDETTDNNFGVNNDQFTSQEKNTVEGNKTLKNNATVRQVCDSENAIIESSKELLKSVERTLSQIGEVTDTTSDPLSSSSQISPCSQPVPTSESIDEPSIYDLHGDTSDSQSDTRSQDSRPTSIEINQIENTGNAMQSNLTQSPETADTIPPKPEALSRQNSDSRSNSRTSIGTVIRRHTLPRLNSTELSRSASSEQESKSPSKARQRTISHMFEQLDLTALNSDQIKIPESFIRRWAAEIIVALATLHSLGVICRYQHLKKKHKHS